MKSLSRSVLAFCLSTLSVPALLSGNVAQVVYEDPDGAQINRGGTLAVYSGLQVQQGDLIETGDATVILSLCEGSLITIYPQSAVTVSGLTGGSVSLILARGEVLGDASAACQLDITTVVGTASISGGVFGVLLNPGEDGALTQQVRNLDGNVTFVPDSGLDTGAVQTSLVEPGKEISVPSGEEIIVQGTYNESTESFSLTQDAALAMLDFNVTGDMRSTVQMMSSVTGGGQTDEPGESGDGDSPEKVIIEIPFEDMETTSDKG